MGNIIIGTVERIDIESLVIIRVRHVVRVSIIIIIRKAVIIKGINGGTIAPRKNEGSCGIAATAESVHTVDDILWHGKFSPPVPSQAPAGGEAHEIVTPLPITSRADGNRTSGPGMHRVIMWFFVSLDIGPELQAAMSPVVKVKARHQGPRADGI
jgi:hypothetical protein